MSPNPMSRVVPSHLAHGWSVAAAILAGGAIFVFAWYLSQNGLLDIMATFLSMFIVSLIRQLSPGLVATAPAEWKRTAGLIATMRADWLLWLERRRLLSHVLLAAGYGVLFVCGRGIMIVLLNFVASPLIAIAIGLASSAMLASPILFKALFDTVAGRLGRRSHRTDAEEDDDARR